MTKLYRLVCTSAGYYLVNLVKVRVLWASKAGNEEEVGVEVVVVELANGLAGVG